VRATTSPPCARFIVGSYYVHHTSSSVTSHARRESPSPRFDGYGLRRRNHGSRIVITSILAPQTAHISLHFARVRERTSSRTFTGGFLDRLSRIARRRGNLHPIRVVVSTRPSSSRENAVAVARVPTRVARARDALDARASAPFARARGLTGVESDARVVV
jgi:hypothetical protein